MIANKKNEHAASCFDFGINDFLILMIFENFLVFSSGKRLRSQQLKNIHDDSVFRPNAIFECAIR